MNAMIAPTSLVLLVLLPLLLALALTFRRTQALALKLAPWAALPVLLQVAFAAPTGTTRRVDCFYCSRPCCGGWQACSPVLTWHSSQGAYHFISITCWPCAATWG